MNAQHSCKSAEWYTPDHWMKRVRRVLGEIDLDPASCPEANRIVKAKTIYSVDNDGLEREWRGKVFLNPPGGRGVPQKFWAKLVDEHTNGAVYEAIYLAYSLEQLRWIGRDYSLEKLGAVVAIPYKRISFVGAGSSPTHGNAFIYLGENTSMFAEEFEEDCLVMMP